MTLNLWFLVHKKSVLHKKVTKSHGVTIDTVVKSRIDCIFFQRFGVKDAVYIELPNNNKEFMAIELGRERKTAGANSFCYYRLAQDRYLNLFYYFSCIIVENDLIFT